MQVFLLLIVAVGSATTLWFLRRRRAADLKAHKEELWLLRLAQQKRVRERLLLLNEESLSLLEAMPGWVESAETHLDQAEVDFEERAFAPFWSSVERAVVSLGRFDESVQRIESNSSEYVHLVPHCKGPTPSFAVTAVSPNGMRLATATSHRLHGIVRRAQCDFQFAVIYEHRKTSQILVAGFKNLAQAVEEMTSQITTSIDRLTTSVENLTSTIDESLQRLTKETEKLATSGHTPREQKVVEVLHRIEQHRYRNALPV
jgi:hypothetical protein